MARMLRWLRFMTPQPQPERRFQVVARPGLPERRKKALKTEAISEWESEGGKVIKPKTSGPQYPAAKPTPAR